MLASRPDLNNWQILGSCRSAEKVVGHEGDGDTNCNWCKSKGSQKRGKKKSYDETIETTALLRSARIQRRVLNTGGDLLLRLQWKTLMEYFNNLTEKYLNFV